MCDAPFAGVVREMSPLGPRAESFPLSGTTVVNSSLPATKYFQLSSRCETTCRKSLIIFLIFGKCELSTLLWRDKLVPSLLSNRRKTSKDAWEVVVVD